eukprot:15461341-Alexandrium_andersonii.AAC.1
MVGWTADGVLDALVARKKKKKTNTININNSNKSGKLLEAARSCGKPQESAGSCKKLLDQAASMPLLQPLLSRWRLEVGPVRLAMI